VVLLVTLDGFSDDSNLVKLFNRINEGCSYHDFTPSVIQLVLVVGRRCRSFEWKSSGFTPSSHVLSHSGPFSSSTTAAQREKGEKSNGNDSKQLDVIISETQVAMRCADTESHCCYE